MDVLLVEPWLGGSHLAWAQGLQVHSRHSIRLLSLTDKGWKWRMQGGAITLAAQVESVPDVVLASSLLDLAAFLGHARRYLSDVPTVLYMHENQLTYPVPAGGTRDTSLAMANWSSMVAADVVAFNSQFHLEEWFGAVAKLLASRPPPTHTELVAAVRAKSCVLPVGIELDGPLPGKKREPPLIVWNQRWEHDKQPGVAAAILTEVASARRVRVALCGEQSHAAASREMAEFAASHPDRVVHVGHAEPSRYAALLADAAIVLSTALHEFFGVGVLEAMGAGAVPVVPNRLAYPEVLGSELSELLYDDENAAVTTVLRLLDEPGERRRLGALARTAAARFAWSAVAPAYDDLLERARPR